MHLVLHFGIHEYVFTITQNALTLQLLGAVLPVPPLGHTPRPICLSHRDLLDRHCLDI